MSVWFPEEKTELFLPQGLGGALLLTHSSLTLGAHQSGPNHRLLLGLGGRRPQAPSSGRGL